MHKTRVLTDNVSEPKPKTWSNCLVSGDLFFVSGLTARENDLVSIKGDNAYDQSKFIFSKIRAYVEAAGGQMNDILKMTIFVTDIAYNTDVWRARAEEFTGDFPACSLVQVAALAQPEILVEIEAMGRIGCST
jgi:2-iminobutanoate/2-iminopropanoate deaminase